MFTARWMVLQLLAHLAFAQDYCTIKCPQGRTHIACNNSGNFAETCPEDRAIVSMTNVEIDKILFVHNDLRNKIASGKEINFKEAANMPALQWDDELAKLAELNVKKCKMEHDGSRNTQKFQFAGQNLGYSANFPEFDNTSSFIEDTINGWYNESKDAKPTDIEKCCNLTVGHFLQLVQDRVTHVGCAISRYTEDGFKVLLMACNYSHTNMLSRPVYVTGKVASKCKNNKKHPTFPSLCA